MPAYDDRGLEEYMRSRPDVARDEKTADASRKPSREDKRSKFDDEVRKIGDTQATSSLGMAPVAILFGGTSVGAGSAYLEKWTVFTVAVIVVIIVLLWYACRRYLQ